MGYYEIEKGIANMKKLLIISLLLAALLLCVSCEKDNKKGNTDADMPELVLPGSDVPGGVVLPEDVFE